MKFKTVSSGFSLIEMVIAIAIMGLLAVVVGPPMLRYLGEAKEKTTQANLQSINQAIDVFHMDTGEYPQTLKDLVRKPVDEEAAEDWKGPYLKIKGKEIPKDGWKHKFVYRLGEEGAEKPFELYSYGAKGKGAPQSEWLFA